LEYNAHMLCRSGKLLAIFAMIGGCAGASGTSSRQPPSHERPNIVFLISDDQSVPDLGCYGNAAIGTPNIDRLAQEGMRFDNAFVSSPQCSPSRAAILTGRSPVAVGMSRLHAALRPWVPSVLEPLERAGYYTAAYRKVHLGDDFQKRWDYYGGFDEPPASFFARRPKDRPFFLWVGFEDPHRPYPHGQPWTPPHDPSQVIVPPYLPDTVKVRQDLAMYYDAIARMDRDAGEVLAALDREGLAKDALVVFAADNGLPFPGAKGSLYDAGIHVPLVVRWPGHVAPGAIDRDLVSLLDLPATWLDAAGVAVPPEMEGRSFLGRLTGSAPQPTRTAVFAERDWHDTQDAIRAVRTTRQLLIHNFRAEVPYAPTFDLRDSLTWSSILELEGAHTLLPSLHQRLFASPRPELELYDLASDPTQTTNLAADPARAADVHALEVLLGQWMTAVNDYLPPPAQPAHGKHGERGDERAP
jgi:N-sulfoglucosamine sulfohydrolase